MTDLTNNDYRQILQYYNKPMPKTNALIKMHAEKIITNKLCRCIKKVGLKNEARSIGICTKQIINAKGFTRGKFKCKSKSYISLKKNKNNITKKRK